MTFNFLNSKETESKIPALPPLDRISKMTPRRFASSVLEVYSRLGGSEWLLNQAIADPKSFIELLKKILPNNIQVDGLDGLTISLVDRFGSSIEGRITCTPEAASATADGKGLPPAQRMIAEPVDATTRHPNVETDDVDISMAAPPAESDAHTGGTGVVPGVTLRETFGTVTGDDHVGEGTGVCGDESVTGDSPITPGLDFNFE